MQDEFSKHANSFLFLFGFKTSTGSSEPWVTVQMPQQGPTLVVPAAPQPSPPWALRGIEPGSLHPARHTLVSCALRVCPCSLHRLERPLPATICQVNSNQSSTLAQTPTSGLPTASHNASGCPEHPVSQGGRLHFPVCLLCRSCFCTGWMGHSWRPGSGAAQGPGKAPGHQDRLAELNKLHSTQATRPLRASSGPQFLHG